MKIIIQAIRGIDYESNQILVREIMPEFGNYIQQLASYMQTNVSAREYRTQSANTEVIRAIVDIVKHWSVEEVVSRNVDLIAGRLLRKESEVQEQLGPMGVRVQKGSLILVLIEKEGNTIFLLAKVEHTNFFDDIDYSIKTGFSKDEKKIWKTCLFEIDDINALQFQAKVYSNTAAKYWWHDFWELQELQSDEVNTKYNFKEFSEDLLCMPLNEVMRFFTLLFGKHKNILFLSCLAVKIFFIQRRCFSCRLEVRWL